VGHKKLRLFNLGGGRDGTGRDCTSLLERPTPVFHSASLSLCILSNTQLYMEYIKGKGKDKVVPVLK